MDLGFTTNASFYGRNDKYDVSIINYTILNNNQHGRVGGLLSYCSPRRRSLKLNDLTFLIVPVFYSHPTFAPKLNEIAIPCKRNSKRLQQRERILHIHRKLVLVNTSKLQAHMLQIMVVNYLKVFDACSCDATVEI